MRGQSGHVKRRGQSWVAVVELDVDPRTGRRRQRQRGGFHTKKEAQQALASMLTGDMVSAPSGTVAEYLQDEWLPSKASSSPATRRQYAWAVGHLAGRVGAVKLVALTPRMVQTLYAELQSDAGLSARSVQMIGKALRSALRDAVRRGYTLRNAADGVPLPRLPRVEVECWDRDEVATFLASPAVRDHEFSVAFRLLLATGMRRGEVCALRWQDIDFDRACLYVRRTVALDGYDSFSAPPKTHSSIRAIALDADTLAELEEWRDEVQAKRAAVLGAELPERVVTHADNSDIHPHSLTDTWDRVVARVGLRRITLHGARHTHATLLLGAGVQLKVVSERLGHSSIQVTADVYQHVLGHMQEEAAQKVGALLPSANRSRSPRLG